MVFFKEKRKRAIAAVFVVLVVAVSIGICAIYVSDYYRADQNAVAAFAPMNGVKPEILDGGTLVFRPENAEKGLIFYPGGKVEYTAYQPLMAVCAEQGLLCALVEMPFNLAVLDINAAEGIQEQYPDIESWYIGGHSLGGSMAAAYLANHAEEYDGLILLGSYAATDLSDAEIDVLSVYGSEDQVMNREKYDASKSNLPDGFAEVVIDGGCHAYFGMYGAQEGDGDPAISNEEQILLTAEIILDAIK